MQACRATRWIFALAVVAGCASPERAEFVGGASAAGAKWFCEMAKDGGWHCVQDPSLVANPRPSRFPRPTIVEQRSLSGAPIPGAPLASQTAQEPLPAPLYQQLAYQPDDPVALIDLPESFYVIQLVALRNEAEVDAFVTDHGLPLLSGALVEKDGDLWFVLLAGVYEDLDTAQQALVSLPENLMAMSPWLRPMASLRKAMLRAEDLLTTP